MPQVQYMPSSTCSLAEVSRSPILHVKSAGSSSLRSLITNVCLPSSSFISNLPLTMPNMTMRTITIIIIMTTMITQTSNTSEITSTVHSPVAPKYSYSLKFPYSWASWRWYNTKWPWLSPPPCTQVDANCCTEAIANCYTDEANRCSETEANFCTEAEANPWTGAEADPCTSDKLIRQLIISLTS